jgi:hypothetical protein
MNIQHTPGPWKIVSGNVHRKFREASIRPVISPFKGLVLPIASVRYVNESFGQANARLIAAAPDLLEALKVARHMIVEDGTPIGWSVSRLDEVIAKATGAV